ncbi:MAG: hypothetical protein CMB78_03210 [Euryarchaeota archaeon]|nr:hypothetical protein [Euryarchaeota archaeon]
MDEKGMALSETVWTRLDRKAGAIVELTVRQLRHRISTWVVLGVGALLMVLLLAFYVDSVRETFEPIDNDGDSIDYDGDGYPMGQERIYGTPDWDQNQYPGSSQFVRESYIDSNDESRNFYGNKSWDGWAFFEASWIDVDYEREYWNYVDWNLNDMEDCSGLDLEDLQEMNGWGNACDYGDQDGDGLTTYFISGKWRGEGLAYVPEQYYLEWGYWTEEAYIEPHSPDVYINEDGIDCFDSSGDKVECPASDRLTGRHGFDDDGDCLIIQADDNRNGVACDVIWLSSNGVVTEISADQYVDEDPDEQEYIGELGHRTFIIAVGKGAFVILLGLFLPLFLALGLVRDETENGTLHLLLSKPIHRAEFIVYRLLGYLAVSGTYVIALSLVVGLVSSVLGPGDSIIRLSDMPVWLGIGLATTLVLAAYGSVFNAMGLISPKYGVYFCIVLGIWEFMMGFLSIINPNWTVSSISISHWALQMVDAIVLMAWPDTIQWAAMDEAFGINSGLSDFWSPPVHTLGTQSAAIAFINSTVILLVVTCFWVLIGKSVFSRREVM